jgi:hypothetical protein
MQSDYNLKQDFLDDKKYSGTAEATLNGYRYDITRFLKFLSDEQLAVNTFNVSIVPIEQIIFSSDTIEVTDGDTVAVKYTLLPQNASDYGITWTSADETIVKVRDVDEVKLIAQSEGKTTIIATTDNGVTAQCAVEVVPKSAYEQLTKDEKEFVNDILPIMICQKLEYNFNHGREAIEWVERNFDYIIIDEAHYLFQDALFNRNTEIMLDMVEQLQKSKVIILMSATADLLKKHFVGRIKKTYHVSADYSYIKAVYCYTTPDSVNKILNGVPPGEKVVMFGDNKNRLRTLHREYPDSEYLNSGNKDESLAFRQITQNECFSCQMLFTTKVLDNGVNLKDKAIKHIIIEQTDMVEFIQCLGRKRVQSPDDTITLYFLSSVCSIAGRYKELKRDLAIVQQYLNARASGYEQEFWKINRTEYIPLMFDNSQHLVKPAYYKALSDCAFYRDILDKKASLVQ